MQEFWDPFWAKVAGAAMRDGVSFIGGDFNMALFSAAEELHKHGLNAVFLGSYAWRVQDTHGGGAALETVRYDSLGCFAVEPVSSIARLITPAMLHGQWGDRLHEFTTAQGYNADAYVGKQAAILKAFEPLPDGTRGGGDELPPIRQRPLYPGAWDATQRLHNHGAHMPVMFFVGKNSGRSTKALTRREFEAVKREWGPGSDNRTWLMARSGKGKDSGKGKNSGKGKDTGKSWAKGTGKSCAKGTGKGKS